jgi:hypothetical protein
MTKLCPRGKAAAKRKFKVYPSAYANAYASKICAGKIKDPSGVKRKDFRGPKPSGAKVGMAVTAGAQSATGRLEKPKKFMIVDEEGNPKKIKQPKRKPFYPHESTGELKKMMSGGFGIFGKKKKEEEKKSVQEENANKKKKRLEELRKEIGAKKGKMMIMIAVGKPKKANKGAIMNVANKLEKASKAHAGQAKTLKSLKLTRGGEMDYSKQKKDKMKTKPYGIEDRKIKTKRLISQKD